MTSAGGPATVALVGLRCVGKTSVGRILAERCGATFVDLDQALVELWRAGEGEEATEPVAAGELLERLGLPAFRDLELRALEATLAAPGRRVVATGGGCVEIPAARWLLRRAAWTLWLREDLGLLARRLAADPTPRPSLTDGDPAAEFAQLADRRESLYGEVARCRVDGRGEGVAEIAARCLAVLPSPWRPPGS